MLKAWNNAVITLILKSAHASSVGDYRPIACCNRIYKIISKMLCHRLRIVLPDLISSNQSVFVTGRCIVQNILICQDIERLYNRKATTKSCLIKIDFKKAYDTIECGFMEEMLYAMNFHGKFIKWVMNCITTTQNNIALDGGLYGNIQGKRGLRQEDPISPLLFVICMQYFSRIMKRVARTYQSVLLMLRGLQSFSRASGLCTNTGKSNIFSANMEQQSLIDLCDITGYRKGTLPLKYLGVSISTKKLNGIDCEMLITAICRNFLWDGKKVSNKAPLIAWDLVCRPKKIGGLGITNGVIWNEAAIAKYIA
ncbi:PREDICTED: uncharacterized protein LOC109213430 [Nicotiana attenuata]|uniref:uncharacterized protein LOC109213430 n=1 Tax=Nicotiana attenuata TaxID=49451 RepID=UPI00090564FA|nr:PREDICTED: uncharacterized protein LOC109213430 [Nicotiana attenuata]